VRVRTRKSKGLDFQRRGGLLCSRCLGRKHVCDSMEVRMVLVGRCDALGVLGDESLQGSSRNDAYKRVEETRPP